MGRGADAGDGMVVTKHTVALKKAPDQPSDDHIAYISGNMDAKLHLEVPVEVYYMTLATYIGMDQPEEVSIQVVVGNVFNDGRFDAGQHGDPI